MYEDKFKTLKKNFNAEIKNIQFFVNNINRLNYEKNKQIIDKLVYGSLDHAKRMVDMIFEVNDEHKALTKQFKEFALSEEISLCELYKHQYNNIQDNKIKRFLKKLIDEEHRHQELVKKMV